ncbi:hypothetical protein L484_001535 [Morus notabilis]|uniref:Plant bHLH transcription factor ACT-like domain-containing protein n=1 Tax=Morus notabilis TaxID=981085 RepID=W9SEG2_9ROSA|nr:hypothetical protein L484_001535 [Morus notabilis]
MVSGKHKKAPSLYKILQLLRSIMTNSHAVKVEAQETGFVIEVFTERSCSGLLVFILETFEELGLDVLHARVSSSHNFHLEAVAITNDNKQSNEKDAQRVEQSMFQAFQRWSEVNQN